MIVTRYEKGQKFLDLCKYNSRSLDDDGLPIEDESWEVVIYENENDYNKHQIIEFGCKALAVMFIEQNNWKEQVL